MIIKKIIYFPISLIEFFFKILVAFIFYIFLVLLRPFITIRIGELESRAIGHFTLPVEIFLSEKDSGITSSYRSIDLFYFNKKICNKFIARKWAGYFHICPRFLIETLHHYLIDTKKENRHLAPYRHWKMTKKWQNFDINNVLTKSKIHLKFSESEIISGNLILDEVGLKDKKIIAFHARDSSYREGRNAKAGFRDSNINNYYMGVNTVVKAGYCAVRIGRVVNGQIFDPNRVIFDYAVSDYASDFMDTYLLSKIHLLVCSGSGIESLALCFRKPLVCVNLAEWVTLHLYNPDQYLLFIPKKFYWIENKLPLSMKKIIELNVNRITTEEELIKAGIFAEENSKEEINDVILEALEMLNGNHSYSSDDLKLQDAFIKSAGLYEGNALKIPVGMQFLKNNLYLLD